MMKQSQLADFVPPIFKRVIQSLHDRTRGSLQAQCTSDFEIFQIIVSKQSHQKADIAYSLSISCHIHQIINNTLHSFYFDYCGWCCVPRKACTVSSRFQLYSTQVHDSYVRHEAPCPRVRTFTEKFVRNLSIEEKSVSSEALSER